MKKHILFFDIDGTLLHVPAGIKVPSIQVKEAIKKLRDAGHLCFIATGRTYAYLNKNILDIGFDGFVTCNGAVTILNNEIIISHYFPENILNDMISFFEIHHNPHTLCAPKTAHANVKYKEIFEVHDLFNVPKENVSTDVDITHINVAKVEITTINEDVKNYIYDLKQKGFEITDHGMNIFEINMPNITKGKGILELLNKLNIPVENSIAFGDGNNDIEMLKVVGHGVAMGNASDECKAAADVVTESVSEEGIVKELQRLGLI